MNRKKTFSQNTPLRCAIVGMGGFAEFHHEAMLLLEKSSRVRLVATCDPNRRNFDKKMHRWRLSEREVRVFDDYLAMLDACAGSIDLLIIPTPIALHARMHAEAVLRNIPVYLEKPPTLDPQELEAMIVQEENAVLPTAVGFNLILEPQRQQVKQRLLDGEFGVLESVSLIGCRPRAQSYFCRNDWAGRLLTTDGRLLLDSCFANAMAHYVHNVLFWAGRQSLLHWAYPENVCAELFRAHNIEGADTFFIEALTDEGTLLRIGMSHACAHTDTVAEIINTQWAKIRYVVGSHVQINWHDGHNEHYKLPAFDMIDHLVATLEDCFSVLLGEKLRPVTTLADCRPFVHLNGLSYLSSGTICPIPSQLIETIADKNDHYLQVNGMEAAVVEFLEQGLWPGQTRGWNPTANAPKVVTAKALPHLHHTINSILAQPDAVSNTKAIAH